MFQYKVLHDILFENKMLFKFGNVTSPLCSFCKSQDETILMHVFNDGLTVKSICYQLHYITSKNLTFLISTPLSAIIGFWNLDTNDHHTLNHSLLIFKMYPYNARTTNYLNINHLLIYIKSIKLSKRNYARMMQKGEKKSIRNRKMF